MGKIKKILETELVGGAQKTDIYPVTSTKAVYDTNNKVLDDLLKSGISNNISTKYSTDGAPVEYTLSQAIAKVPIVDRVSGYVGIYLSSEGWKIIQYQKKDISDWGNLDSWSTLAINEDISSIILSINNLNVVGDNKVTDTELEFYKRIRSIKVKGDYIDIGFSSVTKNYNYGTRILFRYKWNDNWNSAVELKSDTLFNGYTEQEFQFPDGKKRTICIEVYAEDIADGVIISEIVPTVVINRGGFFDDCITEEEVDKKITDISIYPEWFDSKSNPNIRLLTQNEKTLLTYVQQVAIEGYTGSADLDIFSFVYEHGIYGNRFGIAWTKNGERTIGKLQINVDFNSPISYTIDGQECKVFITKSNRLPKNIVYVSRSATSVMKLSNLYLPYVPCTNGEELKAQVSTNTSDIKQLQDNVLDSSTIDFLKNPQDTYNNKENLIISSIKNIGFENVPESIKDDDIFIRTFSASVETTGGAFGQQIYFASKRVYNETQDWVKSSILVSPNIPCNFDVQSFDVTVSSGEMEGMRIRLEVDFSLFADSTPFLYSTNINNKISFNLNKTWSEGTIQERLNKNEKAIEELKSGDSVIEYKPNKNLVFLGSSNVWGDGFLFYSYLKSAVDFLFKSKSSFNSASKVTVDGESEKIYNDKKFLDEEVLRIKGIGSSISFTHKGTELHICQVIERTSEYSVIGLYDGNAKIAEFTNHNNTTGNDSKSFVGDGESTKFELDRCFTYDHSLSVNGTPKTIKLNTQGYGASFPEGTDALVIRSINSDGKVIHSIWFKEAPSSGDNIQVSYKYGETICFVKSTVGEDENGVNESPYGDGNISYDPINPSTIDSGLDYRLVNNKSFYHYYFDNDEERTITLKIERGSANPYFDFNFASSEYHNIMNAGIGGWTAKIFNKEAYPNRAWYDIANYFTPEVVTIGLTGNDDWQNYPRKVKHTITDVTLSELQEMPSLELGGITYNEDNDTYTVIKNAGIISDITLRSLKSEDIKNTNVAVGDFVRIGTYTGDLRQVQTRIISKVNISQGEIGWDEPLHIDEFICVDDVEDLIGQDVSVRSISDYMTQMENLIANIKKINPKCRICLFNVYYVDMWNRNVAEYTYIQKWIASKFDDSVRYVDAWKYARDYVETSSHSKIINTATDGTDSLTFSSPSYLGHWEGIEVWIGDKNVYGTDCYVETGWLYTVNPVKSGKELDWQGENSYLRPYDKKTLMTLKWKRNIPENNTPVVIKLANKQWSSDYAHSNDGDFIQASLGKALVEAIK